MGAELVKIGWRATHPAIVAAWKALEEGAREAVASPGTQVQVLKVSFLVVELTGVCGPRPMQFLGL